MERQKFEDFMQDRFIAFYSGGKDECQDAFDNWLSQLDGEEWITYADLYGRKMYIEGKELIINSMV